MIYDRIYLTHSPRQQVHIQARKLPIVEIMLGCVLIYLIVRWVVSL